jgi:2-hydroxy-6-oxonona-2,4-dienedioate hydrolase
MRSHTAPSKVADSCSDPGGACVRDPRFVDANGTRTRYFDIGEGDPLFLIHGGNYGSYANAEDWDLVVDDLAKHFRVIAIDKIGTGFTDNPVSDDDWLIGASVRHAYETIQTLGLGKVHIAGHSRGGYTVTRLALEHPEVVETLVIVNSSSLMTPPNPQYDQWEQAALSIADHRERMRYLITANSFGTDHITEHYLDVVQEIDLLEKTVDAKRRLAGGLTARFRADLVERQLETHEWIRDGRLTCPTLVMWSYNDPSATMERCGIPCLNLILPNVPQSEMHILNRAGHYTFREQPEAFVNGVVDFIERQRAN